jgi:hypothetical protein
MTPEEATKYLLDWMKGCKEDYRNNPEAFQEKEPGFYIGGMKLNKGDKVITDSQGFPYIIRKGCCE